MALQRLSRRDCRHWTHSYRPAGAPTCRRLPCTRPARPLPPIHPPGGPWKAPGKLKPARPVRGHRARRGLALRSLLPLIGPEYRRKPVGAELEHGRVHHPRGIDVLVGLDASRQWGGGNDVLVFCHPAIEEDPGLPRHPRTGYVGGTRAAQVSPLRAKEGGTAAAVPRPDALRPEPLGRVVARIEVAMRDEQNEPLAVLDQRRRLDRGSK